MTLNFAFWLSLVLASMGCAGLLLAGKGKWYGWGIGLAVQPVWATYAVVTKGYGLLLTCAMYGTVNARNLIRWRREVVTASRADKQPHPDVMAATAHSQSSGSGVHAANKFPVKDDHDADSRPLAAPAPLPE